MQCADAKCRVCVPMRGRLLRRVTVFVRVDVDVAISVVFVFVRVDIVLQGEFQRPQTDAEQHHTHEPFAPRGNPFDWNHVLQREQKQSHKRDARRVTQAPTRTRQPSRALTAHHQRRDGCQMIRSGPDVDCPSDESRECGDDDSGDQAAWTVGDFPIQRKAKMKA